MQTEITLPTEKQIRDGLLVRAKEFSAAKGVPLTEIGKKAVNDSAILSRIEQGHNFTIGTYGRLMTWLDRQSAKPQANGRSRRKAA